LFDDASAPVGLKGTGGHVDRWISVDVGVDHPQVYLEFYDDGEIIWVTREYYWDSHKQMAQKTDGQYADDLMKFMGGDNACQIIVSPEAASFKAELAMRGLWVTDAENAVLEGIQAVSIIFSKRMIRIHRDCQELIKGIESYAWDERAALRGEERPIAIWNDAADALRYGTFGKVPGYRVSA
jgi:hypothetical protein